MRLVAVLGFIVIIVVTGWSRHRVDWITITLPSRDRLPITADVYRSNDSLAPWLVLCHQAGWSRGEYRETAPWFVRLGYNCIAIDLRAGGEINGVVNETYRRAKQQGKPTTYLDAKQDIEAAIDYVRQHFHPSKLILVGSSYSASLAIILAAEVETALDGIIAFSPGEYFMRFGKPSDFVARALARVTIPTLIMCSSVEKPQCEALRSVLQSEDPVEVFVPSSGGAHGSRTLWKRFAASGDYRRIVQRFLRRWFPVQQKDK